MLQSINGGAFIGVSSVTPAAIRSLFQHFFSPPIGSSLIWSFICDSSYDYIPLIFGGGGSRSSRAGAPDIALDHNAIDELFRFQGCTPRGFTRVGLCSRNNYQTLLFSTLGSITPKMSSWKKMKKPFFRVSRSKRRVSS